MSFGNILFDTPKNPSTVLVRIKASKTDPLRKGVTLHLGRTDTKLCLVAALAAFQAVRGTRPGPYFVFRDGSVLSRERLVAQLRKNLSDAGADSSKFAGHSFRIGAATTARARGVQDSTIQTLGRWQSSAYLRYVQIPREELAQLSKTLVT